jgi:hypothetical protein
MTVPGMPQMLGAVVEPRKSGSAAARIEKGRQSPALRGLQGVVRNPWELW